MSDRSRPGRIWYIAAGAIFVSGIILFVVILFGGLKSMDKGMIRVIMPGNHDISLENEGRYTIFYEHRSVIDNQVFATGEGLPGLQVFVVDKQRQQPVAVTPASISSTYSIGSRSGYAIFEFRIDHPGQYEISGWYATESPGPLVVLSVGKGIAGRLLRTVLFSIVILMLSLLIAIATTVITLVKRHQSGKQLS